MQVSGTEGTTVTTLVGSVATEGTFPKVRNTTVDEWEVMSESVPRNRNYPMKRREKTGYAYR
jgi:hypothetical protein